MVLKSGDHSPVEVVLSHYLRGFYTFQVVGLGISELSPVGCDMFPLRSPSPSVKNDIFGVEKAIGLGYSGHLIGWFLC